jgi:hypothetical protein
MIDLETTPELPQQTVPADDAPDPMFGTLHRALQAATVKRLKEYFAPTPTPIVGETAKASGLVCLRLRTCPNKPDGDKDGDPSVLVFPDGRHRFKCLHTKCAAYTMADIEAAYGPLTAQTTGPTLLSCADLDTGDFEVEYLIDGVLVALQPCILGGSKKTLKTNAAIDMALSLATGKPFLGRMAVKRACNVLMFSGESGLATIQETARRICRAKGINLRDVTKLHFSEWLPSIANTKHIEALEQAIQSVGCEVLILDPAYQCLHGGDAGNIFDQGELLKKISEPCQRLGVTPILVHHLRKKGKGQRDYFDVPELDDLSWAGFSEWCRQWLLLGRREAYEPGTGSHKLWLSIGGSAGHSALWGLDIEEGVSGEPRRWEVSLSTPDNARAEKKAGGIRERLLAAAGEYLASGETKTCIFETSGVRMNSASGPVFDSLVAEGLLVECKVVKNRTHYDGYRLATAA